MKNIKHIFLFAVKNQFRMTAMAIITFSVLLICVAGTIYLLVALILNPEMEKAVPDMTVLENCVGLTLFCASFISIGIYASVYTYQSLVREKARGNVQALLATPINPMEIWLGKTLSIFIPGYIFTVVMTVAALLIVNFVYFTDEIGFIVTPWMIVSSLIATPLLYLAVTMFVHIIGLIGKPGTANIIGQIFLPVMANVMIQLGVRTSLGTGSWLFMVILLGTAVAFGIVVACIRPRMTTESIIQSLQG